jgi:D-aminopeptidase
LYYEKEARRIDSRYVETVRRTELFESAKSQAEQRQGGTNLRNNVQQALAEKERFLTMKKKPTPSNTVKSVPREEPSYWKALNVVPTNERVGQTYIISTRQPLPKTNDSKI